MAYRADSLTNPGTGLVLSESILAQPTDASRWSDETGLAPTESHLSPVIGHPVPRYELIPDGWLRWPSLLPSAMWHPLMWLPEALRTPRTIVDSVGFSRVETSDEWALRVLLAMTESGLYDTETGEWADILAAVGVDARTPEGLSRVQAWLDGDDDATLDGVDLSEMLADHVESATLTAEEIVAQVEGLTHAAYALAANEALTVIASIAAFEASDQPSALRWLFARLAAVLAPVPLVAEGGVPTAISGPEHSDFFARLAAAAVQSEDALREAQDRLSRIRDAYWRDLEPLLST